MLREARQLRSSQTQKRALHTVVRLLQTKPARDITFADISARSGVSVGAITFRFGTRDALISQALSFIAASTSRIIARKCSAAATIQSTDTAVSAIVAELFSVLQRHRHLLHDETAADFRDTLLAEATAMLERLLVQRCLNERPDANLTHVRPLARMLVETLANRPSQDDLPHFAALCSSYLRNTLNAR